MATYAPGGADLIDIMGGGMLDQGAKQWFDQQSQAIQGVLTSTGQAFFERARTLYQTVSESQALQMLRNLRSKTGNVWTGNQISALDTLESLQTAGPIMQRWVMAQPDLRKRYLNQQLEGYGESYNNYHGDALGQDHYDYRRVMNGVVEVPEDAEHDWVMREYYDYMEEGDRELTVHEQLDILSTWDMAKQLLMEGGEDPTSQCGNQL